ncbi:MAG: glycosyltransferase family 39 protein [Nanoarchaeota archaeon]|nr:glycosyltransferase family 39 protein [Nanoarchaeota archaeon]
MRDWLKLIRNNKEAVFLGFILLFAFFIRVYSLGVPPLWVDEAISAKAARMILEGEHSVFNPALGFGSAYVLHYFMAFLGFVFGVSEFSFRLVSVIFGLFTIVLAYFVSKEYSKPAGLISALFFAVFYLEVFFSRQSRYYQLLQLAFFASLYFLYKSKENPRFIYAAIISMFVAIDTHLEGLVLAPFFIAHILYYNRKKWFLSVFPAIPLVKKMLPASKLSTGSVEVVSNYAGKYFSYASNMIYLLILFIPGLVLGFFKNRMLTLLMIVPSVIALLGIFSLQTFAFRYSYFFVFPILIYSAVLFGWLYDKYGRIILIPVVLLILIPSSLFFPHTYVNVLNPIDYQFNDPSAPYTDYKNLPEELKTDLVSETILISYFSADVDFYLRKPDFVLPFSLNGIGEDQISIENSKGEIVDRYSGALVLVEMLEKPYNLVADSFSVSKLKPNQRDFHESLIEGCELRYSSIDLRVYSCF